MPTYAYAVTKPDGSEVYEETTFALQSDALARMRSILPSVTKVAVGVVEESGVQWLGTWSNSPMTPVKANQGGDMASQEPESVLAAISRVPDGFFEAIGAVMVAHAWMDSKLNASICILSGIDYNAGVSILSTVNSTKSRGTMLQNLARTKTNDLSKLCKLLVICDVMDELSDIRNTIAHELPYVVNKGKMEITYHKQVVLTQPQISQKMGFTATVPKLVEAATKLIQVGTWLGMLSPTFLPDGIDMTNKTYPEAMAILREYGRAHPHWEEDDQFPWAERLEKKKTKEGNKPLNKDKTRPS